VLRDLDPRVSIHSFVQEAEESSFAEDVRRGLTATPKVLLPKYFYDELGSRLFDAICCLPEYYVARAERRVLERYGGEIVESFPGPMRVVELGSGSSEKTPLLLAPLLEREERVEYVPVDISASALEQGCRRLVDIFPLDDFPELSIRGYVADFETALHRLVRHGRGSGVASTLVLFLGTTIGNLEPETGVALLRDVRALLQPGDALLLGADLVKPESVLIPAYDDALGVTAAFNLNLLLRINRELGGEFALADFRHEARWNGEAQRVEMHIVSRVEQRVAIRALDLRVEMAAGESILSECSYKYDKLRMAELAAAAGFGVASTWADKDGLYSSNLLMAR
jgi:dimethylhistidine N-methyltransferase